VPPSVMIAAGATSASITLTAGVARRNTPVMLSANYAGVTKSATITVTRK